MRILLILGITLMLGPFAAPSLTWAQDETGGAPSTIPTIPKPDLLPGPAEDDTQADVQSYFRDEAIPGFIEGFLGVIAGLALVGVMVGGIRFMTSYGGEEGITAAKKTAIWSVVGFGISLLAYAIVSIINSLAIPQGTYDPNQQETVEYQDI